MTPRISVVCSIFAVQETFFLLTVKIVTLARGKNVIEKYIGSGFIVYWMVHCTHNSECNCCLSGPCRNCRITHQLLQNFSNGCQVMLHGNQKLTCDISGAENVAPECVHIYTTLLKVHLKSFLRNFQNFMCTCFPLILEPYGHLFYRLCSSKCSINKRQIC